MLLRTGEFVMLRLLELIQIHVGPKPHHGNCDAIPVLSLNSTDQYGIIDHSAVLSTFSLHISTSLYRNSSTFPNGRLYSVAHPWGAMWAIAPPLRKKARKYFWTWVETNPAIENSNSVPAVRLLCRTAISKVLRTFWPPKSGLVSTASHWTSLKAWMISCA